MSALTALMIGWGLFWILLWLLGAALSVWALKRNGWKDDDKAWSLFTAAFFGIPIAALWTIAWLIVRWLA